MNFFRTFFLTGCLLVGIYSCVYDDLSTEKDKLKINLRWVQSYPEETPEDVNIGLKWGLSFLGAELPRGSFSKVAKWTSRNIIELDLSQAGFNREAEESLMELLDVFKKGEEYRTFNAIDLGRFVVLTLNSSYHYYAITGAESSLDAFRNTYSFDPKQFAVNISNVSFSQRLIELPAALDGTSIAFIAHEGVGEIEAGTFEANEFEVLTVMSNGQLRFALYDQDGKLKSSASSELTTAGKPAKCLWCHEINLQVLHNTPTPVDGFYSPEEFVLKIQDVATTIKKYRSALHGEIDFSKTQEHTLLELLYIGFMEPSPFRLVNEWNVPASNVEQTLSSLATHQHGEFPFLGEKLFRRSEVDTFSPYSPLQVPEDARESSSFEPDWIDP